MNNKKIILAFILITVLMTSCSTESKIIGKWYDEYGTEVEFFKDGTFVVQFYGVTLTGEYKLVDKETIMLNSEGIIGIFGAQVFTVEISDGQMYLDAGTTSVTLSNEKPASKDEISDDTWLSEKDTDGENVNVENAEIQPTEIGTPWYEDIKPILVYYEDPLSGDGLAKYRMNFEPIAGMRLIAFQVAFQNLSNSNWIIVGPRMQSVSGDGFEYEVSDYGAKCYSLEEVYLYCDDLGNPSMPIALIPPKFQFLSDFAMWVVGEETNNFDLNIKVSNGHDEYHTYKVPLGEEYVQEYKTTFIGNISWEEYKNLPIENSRVLELGETAEFDFGSIKPVDYYSKESVGVIFWELSMEITNSNQAYPMSGAFNEFFVYSPNYIEWINDNYNEVDAGPNQTLFMEYSFGRDYAFFSKHAYAHQKLPAVLNDLLTPFCWIVKEFEWSNSEGSYITETNLIICTE
ncbi:MAG: hypothetical protein ACTSQ8_23410 [Candidatus Helarchaeota archaeon]